jgi:NTE family protein
MVQIRNLLLTFIILVSASSCRYRYHETTEQPSEKLYTNKKINVALALSGAGSKGIVHAGVIAAFEKNKIPIDLIVGSSAGALVGALYAEHKSANKVKAILMAAKRSDFLQGSPTSNLLGAATFNKSANFSSFSKFLDQSIGSKTFEDLNMPLAIVATDIKHSKARIYNSGPIYPAIIASCSIPMLYMPVKIGDDILVDGGVIAPVPVRQALKFNPKIIIAINAVSPPPPDEISNNFSMLYP